MNHWTTKNFDYVLVSSFHLVNEKYRFSDGVKRVFTYSHNGLNRTFITHLPDENKARLYATHAINNMVGKNKWVYINLKLAD